MTNLYGLNKENLDLFIRSVCDKTFSLIKKQTTNNNGASRFVINSKSPNEREVLKLTPYTNPARFNTSLHEKTTRGPNYISASHSLGPRVFTLLEIDEITFTKRL